MTNERRRIAWRAIAGCWTVFIANATSGYSFAGLKASNRGGFGQANDSYLICLQAYQDEDLLGRRLLSVSSR
ncbi:uncharacterized protein LY79DRAFT_561061 [Colletotrichum navitas]|uniref:Uncharacterized protein n=1 Tax=Colletotrichum navitas TaxID=681940 RepID=A0AAD8V2C4_9PEZI|nr:uncharacterized protein LY79DRAFT_561061 [Colletotrichum navitas]KAK1580642.1 hypothetical protein LY79DRAFT_561061 [Colletotrichum navitas]